MEMNSHFPLHLAYTQKLNCKGNELPKADPTSKDVKENPAKAKM